MFQYWFPAVARFAGAATVSLAFAVAGCSQEQTAQSDATSPTDGAVALPQVVATTSVLCDLTEQIAQDTIALTCLMAPGQDPHTYQAKPSDRQAIDEADLVLYGGYGFAPALIGLVEASNNSAPKVAVYEVAVPEPLVGEAHDHAHDHEHGHDHEHDHGHEHGEAEEDDHDPSQEAPAADPHVWHSASNNGAIATVIATNLAQINPEQADSYKATAAALKEQFAELDAWIQAQVDTIPADNRKLITTHDAFRYFANAYGLEVSGALSGLSTEEKPAAATLTSLVEQVKAARVPAIFAESTTNPDLINTVASNAAVKVAEQPLFVEGPGGPGSNAETTQEMLIANTCTIVNALGGTCAEAVD